MRLIHTASLQLREFFDIYDIQYAILSHTWGGEGCEVSYQDMQDGKAESRSAYTKVTNAVAQALKDGYEYLWIDTCCIDKASSAELSEAINSMFRWYQKADICYTYLTDVSVSDGELASQHSSFRRSRWFTRGWTLQELIAPSHVVFYDKNWINLGTKLALKDTIAAVTGVNPYVLDGSSPPRDHSVARRMSWASTREATRLAEGRARGVQARSNGLWHGGYEQQTQSPRMNEGRL